MGLDMYVLAVPIIMGIGNHALYGNMRTMCVTPAIANIATNAKAAVSEGLYG